MKQAARVAVLATAFAASQASAQAAPPASQAAADATARQPFDVPGGALSTALGRLADQGGAMLSASSELTAGKQTQGVHGTYSLDDAFRILLGGTGLEAFRRGDGSFALRAAPAPGPVGQVLLPAVAVAASRGPVAIDAPYAGGQVAAGSQLGVLGTKSAMDTPFSVTSYTQKKIRDDQARSIADVLFANDPSVRTSIGASNRYDAFTIRGLRVANSDVALNGLYGLTPNWRIGTDSVERIELLKGPAAFLFGMAPGGGVGGNVNIVTKRADDAPLTRVSANYSSDAMFGGHLDVGRRFGADDQYGVRFNASMLGGSTPYDSATARSGDVSLGLDYRGDRFRLSGDFIYQNDRTEAQERGYAVQSGIVVPAAPNPAVNLSQPYDYSRSQSTTGMVRAEYDLTRRVTVYGAVGANTFHFNKREASGGTIINNRGDVSVGTNAWQQGQYDTVTGEVGVRGKFTTGPIDHEATVSANVLNQVYRLGQTAYANYLSNIYVPVAADSAVTSSYPETKASELTTRSVALADTMSWHHDLVQLTLGVRRQSVDSKSYSSSTGRVTREYDDSVYTPMAGLVIRPIRQLSLYGNYVEGLTPGPTPPSTAVNSGAIFAPYKSKQYEVGAKVDLGRIGFGLAAFQIDVPNGVTDPTSHIYSLDGLQRNRGIELTTYGEVTRRVRVLGGVTFFDARQHGTAGGATDDRFAIGVPHSQLTLGGEWDLPYLSGLTLTSRVIYTGPTYVDAANQQAVPGWTRFDVGARYAFKASHTPMVVTASITNVLNRRYWESNPSGYVVGGSPRMAWLSVTADF
ncbi:MAG: TonB-dependent receptor [Burkholderia sp.]